VTAVPSQPSENTSYAFRLCPFLFLQSHLGADEMTEFSLSIGGEGINRKVADSYPPSKISLDKYFSEGTIKTNIVIFIHE
jgi:hypothetical protein